MQVLVTGHRGYIGSVLVPQLIAAGHQVTGLDCDLYRACDFGSAMVPDPGLVKDVRDITPDDLHGFDAVIHLAGLSNDPLGSLDPALTREINTAATIRLATAAKAAGVSRFVFSSSCSNYGASIGGDWLTEESALNPVTPYAVSKVESEAGLDHLADEAFTTVYLRSATAYGMSPRIRFDLVANNLTAWAIATGQVMLKSDGSAWRPLVHAEDMARAFVVALEADRAAVHRQAFNVGRNEDCMQIRDLAEIVSELIPEACITFTPGPIVDARTYRVDCSKIRSIGFEPSWSVRRGVAQLRDAFRAHRVRVEDFEGERYQRVAHIKRLLSQGLINDALRRREDIAA
jgi:nucleoside-diphosphate-sugar epimerase